jgi:hypothetical protein
MSRIHRSYLLHLDFVLRWCCCGDRKKSLHIFRLKTLIFVRGPASAQTLKPGHLPATLRTQRRD